MATNLSPTIDRPPTSQHEIGNVEQGSVPTSARVSAEKERIKEKLAFTQQRIRELDEMLKYFEQIKPPLRPTN